MRMPSGVGGDCDRIKRLVSVLDPQSGEGRSSRRPRRTRFRRPGKRDLRRPGRDTPGRPGQASGYSRIRPADNLATCFYRCSRGEANADSGPMAGTAAPPAPRSELPMPRAPERFKASSEAATQ